MNYQKEINLKTFIEKHITRNEKCLILENGKKKKKMAIGIPNSIANNMLVYVFVNSTLSLSDINILLSDTILPITKTYLLLRNPSGLEIQSVELVNVNLH